MCRVGSTKQNRIASTPFTNMLCANCRNSFSAIIREDLPAVGSALSFGVGAATGYLAGEHYLNRIGNEALCGCTVWHDCPHVWDTLSFRFEYYLVRVQCVEFCRVLLLPLQGNARIACNRQSTRV